MRPGPSPRLCGERHVHGKTVMDPWRQPTLVNTAFHISAVGHCRHLVAESAHPKPPRNGKNSKLQHRTENQQPRCKWKPQSNIVRPTSAIASRTSSSSRWGPVSLGSLSTTTARCSIAESGFVDRGEPAPLPVAQVKHPHVEQLPEPLRSDAGQSAHCTSLGTR